MNVQPKQKAILMLHKDHFTLYISGQNHITTMPFPPNMVTDLEILNSEEMIVRIKVLVDTQKIPPAYILVVLAPSTLFDLHVKDADGETQKQETQLFLDSVPFENTASKIYTVAGKKYLVATNKSLFTTVREGFDKVSFKMIGVLPVTMITNLTFDELTEDIGRQLLKRWDELRRFNLYEEISIPEPMITLSQTKESRSRLPVLLGIFLSLIGVLGLLLVTQKNTPPSPNTVASAPITPTIFILPTETQTATPSAALNEKELSVKIFYGTNQNQLLNTLNQQLNSVEVTNIQTETISVESSRPLVVVSPTLDSVLKERILTTLRGTLGDVAVQEADISPFHLIITLGASQ